MKTIIEKGSDIRLRILKLSNQAKSAHAGSALSCVEILTSLFWLKYQDSFPISRFVLSKGHAAMALYSAAAEFGLIDQSTLANYLSDGSSFWGHPSVTENFDFIHWSTGSLGHGLPACVGFAHAEKYFRHDNSETPFVIAVLSDGELNEGSNWEAILFAAHHKLNNLIVIIDYNKIQSFGRCADVADLEPLESKFESFKFHVTRLDGHDPEKLMNAIRDVRRTQKSGPTCIIADTVKGKGIRPIEDSIESHYKPITNEQIENYKNEK